MHYKLATLHTVFCLFLYLYGSVVISYMIIRTQENYKLKRIIVNKQFYEIKYTFIKFLISINLLVNYQKNYFDKYFSKIC